MTVFGLLKLSEYDPERHILPIAHDNLRVADSVYMSVNVSTGDMYLSWQPATKPVKTLPSTVIENADKGKPVKVVGFAYPHKSSSLYIWASAETIGDKPAMSRHPQLSRQQLTDLLDRAFGELEAWDKLVAETTFNYSPTNRHIRHNFNTLKELQVRIKALIEQLAEYK